LIVAEDKLAELRLEPIAFLVGWTAVGCDPARMGLGPVGAVAKVFEKTGLTFDDMGLVEVNEAFAAKVLAVLKPGNGMTAASSMTTARASRSGIPSGRRVPE
jgi:acetyl-CoA C-acetyltransferase